MKRLFTLSILILSAVFASAVSGGKNLVITKGETVTLDLASDVGISINWYGDYIFDQTYVVSDATALSVVPNEHIPNIRSKKGHIKCKCLNMKS